MTDPDFEEYECPACHGVVDLSWKACPHCGVEFDWAPQDPPEIIGAKPAPASEAAAPTTTSTVSDLPSLPVTPGTRVPITIASAPSVEEELAVPSAKDDLSITKTNGHPAPLTIVEATVPNMAPTVITPPQPFTHSEELADLERLINEAVAKAVKENMAKLVPAQAQVQVTSPTVAPPASLPAPRRRGLGAAGLGMLVGGVIGLLVGLNYDVWIRGDTASFIGGIQQYGIIATAIATGFGAAMFALEWGRRKARPARA